MTVDIGEFRERLASGRMSRRSFVQALASAGVAVATLPLVPSRAGAADEHPTFFTWSGYDVPEFAPGYVEKYGRGPDYALFGDEDEAILKIRGGFEADVVFPCSYNVRKWHDLGVLASIDTGRLSHWNEIFESLRKMSMVEIDGRTVWVPLDWGQTSVLYRTDLAPEYVDNETWQILWDPKYAGRLAIMDSLSDGVAPAAIVAGVDPFRMGDAEIEIVRAKLQEQRPLLRFYSNDLTSIEQALASGEVVAAVTWNQSFTALKRQGLPVKFMQPKEGAMTWVCGLCILEGSSHMDMAHEFIDAALDPRSRAWEIREIGFGSATQAGFDLVDDETLAMLGLPRDPTTLLESGIFQEPMENQPEIQMMFEEIKAGA